MIRTIIVVTIVIKPKEMTRSAPTGTTRVHTTMIIIIIRVSEHKTNNPEARSAPTSTTRRSYQTNLANWCL